MTILLRRARAVTTSAAVGLALGGCLLAGVPAAQAAGPTLLPWFAGYNGTTSYQTATVQFTVPAITCGTANHVVAPGVYINDGGSAYYIGAEVALYCTGTFAQYVAIAYGRGANGTACTPVQTVATVHSGDVIVATATAGSAPTGAVATVQDLTSHVTVTASTGNCGVGNGPPYTGICAPSSSASLPNWCDASYLGVAAVSVPYFAPISMTKAYVNGASLGSTSPALDDMQQSTGSPMQIQAGPITSGGTAFTETWLHN